MIPLTPNTVSAAQRTVKNPGLVLCINEVDGCYGSSTIFKIIRVGDPGLFIDGSWVVGGVVPLEGQKSYVSLQGSSTSIKQQIDYDKGRGSSIQSLDIELIDVRGEVTQLITPGNIVEDVLGRKAKIYLALDAPTAKWPEDYILLFRGVIDDIKSLPASVVLTVSHPEQKKKASIYNKVEAALTSAIDGVQTTVTLDSVVGILQRVLGPDGLYDVSFKSYIRVGTELIEFTGISGNTLTGCVRGQVFTVAASHAAGADVATFYRLKGNAMDLALKIMISRGGPWLEDVPAYSFNVIPGEPAPIPNIIFFNGVDARTEFGFSIGDYVSSTGATNGANNFTLKQITAIVDIDLGTYIEIGGVTFVDEPTTSALIDFRSKYDTLPEGLRLGADEVDVAQHEYLKQQYLSSFSYDFYLKESIGNARDFMDAEIYKPASAYSVARKARCSVQLLIGPIPGSRVSTLNKSNIVGASKIKLRRSINKNFYNTIVYKFEEDELEEKFLRGIVTKSQTSADRIPVGTRPLVIVSKGLREVDLGGALALSASNRRLNRYKFGAEFIEGLGVHLGAGFDVEVGDIVVFDPAGLSVSDTVGATRQKPPALFEVSNKSLNYKTGEVTIDLVDTAFDENARYGLYSPSSLIKSGISPTQFVIEASFGKTFGTAEFQKWQRYPECMVIVKSPDGTTRYAVAELQSANSNTITVTPALGFTPLAGDIMELAPYDVATAQIKLIYAFMSPLTGGDPPFLML